jgi:predicted 2-oxoglutarate/Fe(II)-dependent dioxygenase YbiX
MEIKNFIKIYDEVLKPETLNNLLRFVKTLNFEKAGIVRNQKIETNFDIRKTYNYDLDNKKNSFTEIHWFCFLLKCFTDKLNSYPQDIKIIDYTFNNLLNISVLKYENTGFFKWHTDHVSNIPRTMSCIFILNDEFEGGNLCFRNPDGSEEWEVETKPNKMIIWPSNFLFPHTVKPVTKGTRYSIVAWAL